MLFLVLFVVFLLLFVYVFHPPFPNIGRLLGFLLLLGVAGALAYLFVVRVLNVNPDPARLQIAHTVTENKIIDLQDVVPGLGPNLGRIYRLDTDEDPYDRVKLEWVVTYQYDISTGVDTLGTPVPIAPRTYSPVGPWGAAIYDPGLCRPPTIRAFELIPVHYDYLGQESVNVLVANILHDTPGNLGRPEVIVNGRTRGVVTDLNIFRMTGNEPNCEEVARWRAQNPNMPFIYPGEINYLNVGSFRGNYLVTRSGSTVNVYDSAGFERSQIVVRKMYQPSTNGTYWVSPWPAVPYDAQQLVPPKEYGLEFGPGWPENIPQVYYPEKAVLAFYLSLTDKPADLQRAKSYLSQGAQSHYDIDTDTFGLYSQPDGIAQARSKLARVLVEQIRYEPNMEAEHLHADREVAVTVVGVNAAGDIDWAHPCQVTWRIVAALNPQALPYGCEWRLDRYQSTCPGPGQHGELQTDPVQIGWQQP